MESLAALAESAVAFVYLIYLLEVLSNKELFIFKGDILCQIYFATAF